MSRRLKFRQLSRDIGVGETFESIVVILFDLAVSGVVVGVVTVVQTLLVLVLLPTDEPEELLVLELNLRSLPKAPILDNGGLEASDAVNIESRDSGAA